MLQLLNMALKLILGELLLSCTHLPFNLQKFVKKLLDDMLEQRIIELASGPWSSRCQTKIVHHAFMGLSRVNSPTRHILLLLTPVCDSNNVGSIISDSTGDILRDLHKCTQLCLKRVFKSHS